MAIKNAREAPRADNDWEGGLGGARLFFLQIFGPKSKSLGLKQRQATKNARLPRVLVQSRNAAD
jgi:hypothetical protein